MSLGSLKTLYTALKKAPTLQGVTVEYGEEMEPAQEFPLPLYVIIPQGGPFKPGQGYIKGQGQNIQVIWTVDEQIDVVVWGASATGADRIDSADATEQAAALMLQAFANQRPQGLTYRPVSRRWATMDGGLARYGRGLVLSFVAEVPIPGVTTPTVTVESVEIDDSITA